MTRSLFSTTEPEESASTSTAMPSTETSSRFGATSTAPGEAPGVTPVGVERPDGADPGVDLSAGFAAPGLSEDAITDVGPIEAGMILFGRYRIVRKLGQGGMGSVWLVRHLELDALRALKLIDPRIAADPQVRGRFKREAQLMARLDHPHAASVHDARLTQGAAFIEMEYIRGQSLSRLLTPGGPMPLDWTGRVLEQLCDVLQAAHDRGIVHRDLKPSNMMLVEDRPPGKEFLKVLDFGIAKILSPDGTSPDDLTTRSGAALFTPQYASPEQVIGGAIDTRSDLYSVGVILYELLTGYRPFAGPHVTYQHLSTPAPRFAERNPAVVVPPEIEQLVLRCLAKNPAERPQSARELFEEFQRALARPRPAAPTTEEMPEPATPPLPPTALPTP
ncbi:MAG: serine/threonine protein kinase, partial [Isosphaeraceae bacterium]|nr:serine/threonine protein kinase [Isosphaeraceae bacterium]